MGRPTKEHYSVCGLILLKDYYGWTNQEAVDQYLYNLKIHYALMIEPDNLEFSMFFYNEADVRLFEKMERSSLAAKFYFFQKFKLDRLLAVPSRSLQSLH